MSLYCSCHTLSNTTWICFIFPCYLLKYICRRNLKAMLLNVKVSVLLVPVRFVWWPDTDTILSLIRYSPSRRLKCDFMHVKGGKIISKYTKWYWESWPEIYFNAFTTIKPKYIKPLRWMIISYCEHSMISSLKTLFSRWILLVDCRNFMSVFSSSWTNPDTIVDPFSVISTRQLSAATKEITKYFFKHINHFLHISAPPFTSDLNIRSPWCFACGFCVCIL